MYKEIINDSFNSVFKKKKIFFKALLIPLILLVILERMMEQYALSANLTPSLLLGLCLFLININIAIATHRILLIEENPVPTWGLFKLTGRELKFIYYSIIIGILAIVPAVILALIPYIGVFLTVICIVLVFARLSLCLPSIAIDEDMSLSEAWEYSSNYKILTVVTIILVPILVAAIVTLVYSFVIGFLIGVVSSELVVLYSVLNLFVTIFIISALSATYKYIMDHRVDTKIKKVEESKEIYIDENEDSFKAFIPMSLNVEFEDLKNELYEQYNILGFTNIVVDKDYSWMLKNPNLENSYISLSFFNDEFKIESYNTKKPELDIFNSNI